MTLITAAAVGSRRSAGAARSRLRARSQGQKICISTEYGGLRGRSVQLNGAMDVYCRSCGDGDRKTAGDLSRELGCALKNELVPAGAENAVSTRTTPDKGVTAATIGAVSELELGLSTHSTLGAGPAVSRLRGRAWIRD